MKFKKNSYLIIICVSGRLLLSSIKSWGKIWQLCFVKNGSLFISNKIDNYRIQTILELTGENVSNGMYKFTILCTVHTVQ